MAREYGLPSVRGVHQVTTRLQTGQRVRPHRTERRVEVQASTRTMDNSSELAKDLDPGVAKGHKLLGIACFVCPERAGEKTMHTHPLAEVFGFPPDNFSLEAKRYRKNKLCPFNNRVPSCTKDKANDPLGVCSILEKDDLTIVCPIRFRERWIVTDDAAAFFFPPGVAWTTLTEVRLNDRHGKSAGNIDVVLVAYDDSGRLLDFGALEIQSVYISGNIRRPFTRYMSDPDSNYNLDWTGHANYPRPDYLSSSRKRLAPQLIYKGGILNSWGKKMAVALHNSFYETLPALPEVEPESADIAWIIYTLEKDSSDECYRLQHSRTIHTCFKTALDQITTAEPGPVEDFIERLQEKLDDKLEEDDNLPDAPTLADLLVQ